MEFFLSLMKKFNLWITCSMKRFVLMCLTLLFIAAGINYPQIKQLKKLIPKNIPGLEKILQAEPAITTSFEDAVFGIPFLDDFNRVSFVPEFYREDSARYVYICHEFDELFVNNFVD